MDQVRRRLDIDRIVDAACDAISEDGLQRLSMRRLGARLGVDPMAVYHHVRNKQALLALVMARVVGAMPPPDDGAPWQERVRQWGSAYWDVVVANRELVAAGLADPVIAEGGMPAVAPLHAAVVDSGLPAPSVDANVYLVVDFVHGSALGSSEPLRVDGDAAHPLQQYFEAGLATVIAGIEALAASAADGVDATGGHVDPLRQGGSR